MKNLMIKSALLLITFLLTSSIFAQQPNFNQRGQGRIFSELNLSEEQKEQMQKFRLEHQEYVLDIKNTIEKNRIEIKKMLLQDNFDESQLITLSNKNSDLKAKIKDSRLKMWLDTYKLLNADQQKIWKKTFLRVGQKGMRNQKGMRGKRGMRCPEDNMGRRFNRGECQF